MAFIRICHEVWPCLCRAVGLGNAGLDVPSIDDVNMVGGWSFKVGTE